MKARNPKIFLLVTGCVTLVLFAIGVTDIFLTRFELGDVYPPYSSLRADPLGCRALHDSLQECEGIQVTRSYESFSSDKIPLGSAVLFLGDTIEPLETIDAEYAREVDRFVKTGGRLVFTFAPENRKRPKKEKSDKEKPKALSPDSTDEKDSEKQTEKVDKGATEDDEKSGERNASRLLYLQKWLGVTTHHERLNAGATALLDEELADTGLPMSLSAHSSLVFSNGCALSDSRNGIADADFTANKEWRTIYTRDGHPVVLEGRLGAGSIVLSSLSYFTSNEAMQKDRHSGLLVWMLGDSKNIVFDESHLGIVRRKGVVMLAREYGLLYFGIGLLALGVLYVWQHSIPLIPPEQSDQGDSIMLSEGRDSRAALHNLLLQNLPRKQLARVCVEEWLSSSPQANADFNEKKARIEALVNQHEATYKKDENLSRLHNDICRILKK